MDLQSLIARNEKLLSTPVDRDLVFLVTASNSYVALDEIGRRIWELLEHPRRIADLIGKLSDEFEGSPDAIGDDLLAFFEDLEREGMVHVVDERPA